MTYYINFARCIWQNAKKPLARRERAAGLETGKR
nr:MAG TPA: hypothetical protein [Caudoviricetes sp.]DAU34563.1 MAG TPA: hypothetical protein [Caudoviricetes sp.]